MMQADVIVGPQTKQDGALTTVRGGRSGELSVSDAHGRYQEAVMRQNVYYLSATNVTPTAYIGAGGGSPLLAIHNPSNSGKVLVVLAIGFGHRVGGSAAGATTLAAWAGSSVLPTGSQTAPRNAYSQATSGAAGLGFVNTALTSSSLLNMALPLWGYQIIGATPVSQGESSALFDVAGLLVAVPGNEIAVGLTVVPTSMTADISMYWEEIPV